MLTEGIEGKREIIVTAEKSARAMGSGELEVFATPALAALIEETAWRSVAPELEDGQGTVGTRLELDHLAATPLGMSVRCETVLTAVDRRRLTFTAEVYDEAGLIGKAVHERFIVDNAKFQAKADGKKVEK